MNTSIYLLLQTEQAEIWSWRNGQPRHLKTLSTDTAGASNFGAYWQSCGFPACTVLLDVPGETYQLSLSPKLNRQATLALRQHRLAEYFPQAQLCNCLARFQQGKQTLDLLAAHHHHDYLNPWLKTLEAAAGQLRGLFLLPQLLSGLIPDQVEAFLVTPNRQLLIRNRQLCFARQLNLPATSPEALEQSLHTLQIYLCEQQVLSRTTQPRVYYLGNWPFALPNGWQAITDTTPSTLAAFCVQQLHQRIPRFSMAPPKFQRALQHHQYAKWAKQGSILLTLFAVAYSGWQVATAYITEAHPDTQQTYQQQLLARQVQATPDESRIRTLSALQHLANRPLQAQHHLTPLSQILLRHPEVVLENLRWQHHAHIQTEISGHLAPASHHPSQTWQAFLSDLENQTETRIEIHQAPAFVWRGGSQPQASDLHRFRITLHD